MTEKGHDPDHWYSALVVAVGWVIRRAQLEEGMPTEKALMLVECIRTIALDDERRLDA